MVKVLMGEGMEWNARSEMTKCVLVGSAVPS